MSEATSPSRIDQVVDLVKGFSSRLDWDEYFMSVAHLVASRSPCSRLHVGTVLVTGGEYPNRIISTGYNGYLPGSPHTSHIIEHGGSKHEMGTVHSEQNAVADAARRGVSTAGATAYVCFFPCVNCVKVLVAAGIKTIKYHAIYNNGPGMDELALALLKDANVEIIKV